MSEKYKKLILRILAGIFVIISIFVFTLWLYNLLTAVPQWYTQKHEPKHEWQTNRILKLHYNLDKKLVNIFSVDLSTVTSVVFLISILSCAYGFWQLSSGHKKVNYYSSEFPLWSDFKTTFIQLGLLGTIFGFIIAFNLETKGTTKYDPDIIYSALGTALYSTFSAAILAYILIPLFIIPPFRYLRKHFSIEPEGKEPDGKSTLKMLNEKVTITSKFFGILNKRIDKTNEALQNLEKQFGKAESYQESFTRLTSLQDQFRQLENDWMEQRANIQKNIQQINDKLNDNEKTLTEFKNQIAKMNITSKINKNLFDISNSLKELESLKDQSHGE